MGTTWRGLTLSAEDLAEYQPGATVTWAAFSSTSKRRTGAFGGNVVAEVRGRHGKDIQGYSAYASEDEVLFKAGTRFRVCGHKRVGGVTEICLEEIDDG